MTILQNIFQLDHGHWYFLNDHGFPVSIENNQLLFILMLNHEVLPIKSFHFTVFLDH